MYPRIKTAFSTMSATQLVALGYTVSERMKANAAMFSEELNVDAGLLADMCRSFQASIDKASTRDSVAITEKNKQKDVFKRQLKKMAVEINFNYTKNLAVLESSGFEVMLGAKTHNLKAITSLEIKPGSKRGSIVVRVIGGQNYHSLRVYVYKDLEMKIPVKEFTSTRKTFEDENYEFGQVYFIKVQATGIDNDTAQSDLYPFVGTYAAAKYKVKK